MNIFSKLKSFFTTSSQSPSKELLSEVFQNYLKIRADLQVSDIKLNGGVNFKVAYKGSVVPFWIAYDSGMTAESAEPKIQNALSTIAVGLALNLNLVEISQSLKEGKVLTPVIQ